MKLIWYFVSLFLILFILINNPRSNGVGILGNQGQVLNSTRSTEKNLQLITIILVFCFFLLTIYNSIYID